MATIKNWIKACRFRTLPLAASVILAGSALVYLPGYFNWAIFLFSLITTFLLQIVSNLANDYGDYSSGADGADRIGPKRTMQEGVISKKEMTIALILFSGLSLFSGSALLYLSFTKDELVKVAIFFGLGIVAIIAAIKYTVGKSAYG